MKALSHTAQIEFVPIDSITPHPSNPRHGDVGLVKESIIVNGFFGAVMVQRSRRRIIAGEHRWRALQAAFDDPDVDEVLYVTGDIVAETGEVPMRPLPHGHVPVIWANVDDEGAKRILLADNRTSDVGTYDDTQLVALLQSLEDTSGTGYTGDDLNDLLTKLAPKPTLPDNIDEAPAAPAEPRSRRGDIWLLGEHRLLCGDATVRADVERVMKGERATLMATDPPYLVNYTGGQHPPSASNNPETRDENWDDYVDPDIAEDFYSSFLEVALDVALTERAPIYQWYAIWRHGIVEDAWAANGLLFHQAILWVKARGVLTRSHFMWRHEPCFYGWRKGKQAPLDRRPPNNETTVWDVDQRGNSERIHPTQKPVELIERPIRWHTKLGEVIYEPFAGSGTAIIAAELSDRRCFAIEKSPRFVDVVCARFERLTGVVPILESDGSEVSFL